MGDMGDTFRAWKEYKQERRNRLGVECQECVSKLPKASPSILLSGQRCRIHGWRAPDAARKEKK